MSEHNSRIHRPRILIVDDEPGVITTLKVALEANGFETITALDGNEALKIMDKELPDLMILDIIMPGMDGFEVCRRVRHQSQIPIIMLSARHSEEDKVRCLDLGSDDYIAKPFGMRELIARVKAALRRTNEFGAATVESLFTCSNISIDFAQRKVTVDGNTVNLTPTEYSLLRELVLNKDKVLTHNQLLERVWGADYGQEREYLRVFIGRLRSKLEHDPSQPKHIVTLPGIGYKFQSPE